MTDRWRTVLLGDIAEVTVGHVGPMAAEYVEMGIPFLRSLNIEPHRIDLLGIKYITPEFHARLKKSALKPGDVVTVRTGKPGATAVVPEHLPEVNCSDMVITRPGAEIDSRWLSYYINGVAGGYISSRLVGAVQQHFNVGSAKEMVLALPPLVEQRGIATTLGVLDDKIESNRLSGALIQQLCRSIFNDWRGRCADYVAAESTFGDFAEVFGGATPKTTESNYWNGGIAWATPTDMTALSAPYLFATSRTVTESGLASTSAMLHPPGTILMTSRATIGVFAVNQIQAATNQGFIAVRPKEEHHRWFLFEEMRSRIDEFLDNANGSTFLELSRGRFKQLPLYVPSESELKRLDSDLGPLHAKAAQLDQESTALMRLRDTLLPELLSGRIRVPESKDDAA